MAPKGRGVGKRRSPTKSRRSRPRKKLSKPKNCEASAHSTTGTGGGCSTPKARRFRIPAPETCPPAPKKQRVASKSCLLQKRPIAFFAHPDIELFFNFAFRGISV